MRIVYRANPSTGILILQESRCCLENMWCLASRRRPFEVMWAWGEGSESGQKCDLKHFSRKDELLGVAEFREEKAEVEHEVLEAGSRGEGEGVWYRIELRSKRAGKSSSVRRWGSPCCGTSVRMCIFSDSLSRVRAGDGLDNFLVSVVTFSSSFFLLSSTTYLPYSSFCCFYWVDLYSPLLNV